MWDALVRCERQVLKLRQIVPGITFLLVANVKPPGWVISRRTVGHHHFAQGFFFFRPIDISRSLTFSSDCLIMRHYFQVFAKVLIVIL